MSIARLSVSRIGLMTAGIAGVVVTSLVLRAKAGTTYTPDITVPEYQASQSLMGEDLRKAVGIPKLTWTEGGKRITLNNGAQVTLTRFDAPEGYENLQDCPAALEPVQVMLPDHTAYCIQGASADAESAFMASDVIVRLTQNRLPSETELKILRVEAELALVDPESEIADSLIRDLEALRAQLTPAEQDAIEEGRELVTLQ